MGAKSGEQVARNLWWPKLCEERHCCPAKWHLVPWLAEHIGWGGTQSHPYSVGQLGSPEWWRVVFYQWGGYMLTHVITDLPPQLSTFRTAYPTKCSQNLRQTAIVESNSEAGDLFVNGIMDHYCLVQGRWCRHHAARVQQSTRVKGILTACCVVWAKWNSCHLTWIKCEKY